ncbi:Thiol-disulfide oxidoreductase ResA [Thalassocella blandensis]|nr:Thiol-disulfide oxidoreductase ResA [Thalassocella blandensis]
MGFSILLQWSSPALSLNVAPDWLVKTTEGETISLQQELQRGQKVVMLFWASWCRYCKQLLPEVQLLSQQLKDQPITFVTLNIWQNGGENTSPKNYYLTQNIHLPLVMRADMIAAKYQLKTTPGIFVIKKGREIVYQYHPGSTTEQVVQDLEKALMN